MRTVRVLNDLRVKTFTIPDDSSQQGGWITKGGRRLRIIHGMSTRKYYDSSNPRYRITPFRMDELVSLTELAIRFYNFKEHTNFGQVKVLKGKKSSKDLPPNIPQQQTLSDASVNDVAPYISQYALAMYSIFTLNVKKEPLHDISSVRVVKAMKHDAPSRKVVKGKKPVAEDPTYLVTFEASLQSACPVSGKVVYHTSLYMKGMQLQHKPTEVAVHVATDSRLALCVWKYGQKTVLV
ncbi:hypothetical protein POM88_052687 [Heracleum sosnowskyi]|uniref:Uncharacterized protein n=1 Tax=Heracleum sosnowskyi TaxID=360622 RepID=A0AAD8LYH9_9APIA|nr:hypothetical protein POM88_052687 [Heracleum sosnowskyi]